MDMGTDKARIVLGDSAPLVDSQVALSTLSDEVPVGLEAEKDLRWVVEVKSRVT